MCENLPKKNASKNKQSVPILSHKLHVLLYSIRVQQDVLYFYRPKIVQSILAKGRWKDPETYGMITKNRDL